MKCNNCGNEIADDSAFCNKCGTAIQKETVKTTEEKTESNTKSTLNKNDKTTSKSKGKGCLSCFFVIIFGIIFFVVVFFFYANAQGSGKEKYACELLTSLLQQNFGENAAECKSFTVTTTPEWGLWFPEFGVIIEGQDIGTAVLSNGTVMRDVVHDYRSGHHKIRVQNWGKRQDYLKNRKPNSVWD